MYVSEQAQRLYKESVIWDNSLIWSERVQNPSDLAKLRQSGVTVVSLTLNPNRRDFSGVIQSIAKERMALRDNPDYMLPVNSDDVYTAKEQGKTAITFGLMDITSMENPFIDIEIFSALGVTHVQLAALRNFYGDCFYESSDVGLSSTGRYLVKYYNKQPVLLDGTLGGYKTTMEAMDLSEKPFIFSHANPAAMCKNRRNISDEQILACAKTGGVVGITLIGGYLGDPYPSADNVFRNIDHICQLTGSSGSVGIGSNYMCDLSRFWDHMGAYKQDGEIAEGGCFDYALMPQVVQLMLDSGYDENEIRNILGLNWARVYRKAKGGSLKQVSN